MRNRIRPTQIKLGYNSNIMKPRTNKGNSIFFEKDLQFPGINKETNNYPINEINEEPNLCDGLDSDTCLFITAAGITSPTLISAIDTLVLSAKSNGWWDLCKVIYPFVGGTATTHKFNLKDPRDLDAAFRLDFLGGGWIHSSTGALPNGVSSYANSHFKPGIELSGNSSHMSFYSRTNSVGIECWGLYENAAATKGFSMYLKYSDGNFYCDMYNYLSARITVPSSQSTTLGFYIGSRISNNDVRAFKNGSQIGNTQTGTPGTIPILDLYMNAANYQGVVQPGSFSPWECSFATLGNGINDSIAYLMYSDIQTFQTSLGRQV